MAQLTCDGTVVSLKLMLVSVPLQLVSVPLQLVSVVLNQCSAMIPFLILVYVFNTFNFFVILKLFEDLVIKTVLIGQKNEFQRNDLTFQY